MNRYLYTGLKTICWCSKYVSIIPESPLKMWRCLRSNAGDCTFGVACEDDCAAFFNCGGLHVLPEDRRQIHFNEDCVLERRPDVVGSSAPAETLPDVSFTDIMNAIHFKKQAQFYENTEGGDFVRLYAQTHWFIISVRLPDAWFNPSYSKI